MAYAYDLNIFFRYLKEFNPTLKDTEIKNIPVELLNLPMVPRLIIKLGILDVLGHSDINTTAKHYAASEDAHRRQAAKIDTYE